MRIDDLEGQACLVTGASRGIGAAVARGLGAAGMRVVVHYRSGEAEARAVVAAIEGAGGQAFALQGDIAAPGAMAGLVDQASTRLGRLDVLINNAGDLIERCPAADTPDELFERQVAVNMRPVFEGCRAAVRQFRAQGGGGCIVNLSSIAARTGGGGSSSLYAAAKAFVATFTRALAKEVAADGIRVNAVAPGVIATPMQDRTTPPEALEALRKVIPLGRIGTPEECVAPFYYSARRGSAATSPGRSWRSTAGC